MAHELATTNGKASIAYFGTTPWHRLGTQLNEPATAAEAIEAVLREFYIHDDAYWMVPNESILNSHRFTNPQQAWEHSTD